MENGNDFRGLDRVNGNLVFDSTSRFGAQTSWHYFYERVGGGSDDALLGDANVTFRFAQNDWLQVYAGLGMRYLTDQYDAKVGFNFLSTGCRVLFRSIR